MSQNYIRKKSLRVTYNTNFWFNLLIIFDFTTKYHIYNSDRVIQILWWLTNTELKECKEMQTQNPTHTNTYINNNKHFINLSHAHFWINSFKQFIRKAKITTHEFIQLFYRNLKEIQMQTANYYIRNLSNWMFK